MEFKLTELNKAIRRYYFDEGYKGQFGYFAYFEDNKGVLELRGPSYAKYMLYGRNPGKMPPIRPIENWCRKYGINASPWAVRYNIGKYGTKGNDFITKNMNDFKLTVQKVILEAVTNELTNNFKDIKNIK